jgi:hypothetical protein
MASTAPADVIRRLLDDDTIHEHIAEAGAGMRDAYRRARNLPPTKAVQDKTVYDRLRQAAGGATEATRRALGKPEPKPKRGRGGLAVLVLGATGAVVWWAAKRDRQSSVPLPPSGPPPAAPVGVPPAAPAGAPPAGTGDAPPVAPG